MKTKITLCLVAVLCFLNLRGQQSSLNRIGIDYDAIHALQIDTPDYDKWRAEDDQLLVNRFAGAVSLAIDPASSGSWLTIGEKQIWTLRLEVPQAQQLAVFYDQFDMPVDGRFFTFTNKNQSLEFHTNSDIPKAGRYWTGFTEGEVINIAYEAPIGTTRSPFKIWRIDAGYGQQAGGLALGFGTSSICHDNIICPAGDNWQTEKHAAARIIVVVEEGSGYCSGTIMNNTAQDNRLLFLSAFHCMDGYTPLYDLWRFDFEYESLTCSNPVMEPGRKSILGSTYLAGRQENDMLLLDLTPPDDLSSFGLHFSGWDRAGVPSTSAGVIHHPRGDIQKVALSTATATIHPNQINWNNGLLFTPPNHHYRVTYSDGTIEVGSSGSALFDQNHRVIATLQGDANITNCNSTVGYFSRFNLAWEGGGTPETRLKDWLDPLETDMMVLDGSSNHGRIVTDENEPVSGVEISFLVDDVSVGTMTTDTSGRIVLPVGLPETGTLAINFAKSGDFTNGVSTVDLIRIQKHILTVDTLDTPYRVLGSDVNDSGSLSTLDIIRIRKLILTISPDFGDGGIPSWQFYQAGTVFENITAPWAAIVTGPNTFTFELGVNFALPGFIGVKSADANSNSMN